MNPHFLLCPPTYFTVNYEINPWMDGKYPVDVVRAQQQFEALAALYRGLGCRVSYIEPVQGLPDMVFTANGAVTEGKTALVANFRFSERRPESRHFAEWFSRHGYHVLRMPSRAILEGQGEVFFVNDHIFAGYGFRANKQSHQIVQNVFKKKVVSLKLIDPRWYHLDTCLCPLRDGIVLYYPGAFDVVSRASIKKYATNAIAVSKKEALDFLCNSVPIGNTLVTGALPSKKTVAVLKKIGYSVVSTPLTEFKKSGGGARCLTLNLSK